MKMKKVRDVKGFSIAYEDGSVVEVGDTIETGPEMAALLSLRGFEAIEAESVAPTDIVDEETHEEADAMADAFGEETE